MGTAILVAPRTGRVVAGIGCLVVVVIGLLAVFGHYTQHVNATGRLVPSRGLLTLTSAEAGELTSLRVHQGQSVHQGRVRRNRRSMEEYVPELHLPDAFASMLAEGSPRYRLGSDDAVTDAAFMDSPYYGLWSRERASSGNDERFVTFV